MAVKGEFDVRNIEIQLNINAPAESVFEAWTNPSVLQKWFSLEDSHTMPIVEIDLRTGAKYRIGIKHPDGSLRIIGGVFKRIIPNEMLSFTWSVGGGGTQQKKSIVVVEFINKTDGSGLVVKHQFITGEKLRFQFETEWKTRLARLEKVLAEGNIILNE